MVNVICPKCKNKQNYEGDKLKFCCSNCGNKYWVEKNILLKADSEAYAEMQLKEQLKGDEKP